MEVTNQLVHSLMPPSVQPLRMVMKEPKWRTATEFRRGLPLHTVKPLPQTTFNRVFAAIYTFAILILLYHHLQTLLLSKNSVSFFITFILLLSDLVLAFMWANYTALRLFPVYRKEFLDNVEKVMDRSDFPGLDVFICTADPYKEPPIGVVNTALSVMAYDYPPQKISVYVSDDGGSVLTLFAFVEAAKFAAHWLPFCKKNNIVDRNPEVYFESDHDDKAEEIKIMYESMKMKIEHVLDSGKIDDHYISGDGDRKAFNKWTNKWTKQDHPAVIQVLLDSSKDRDVSGEMLPNLVYVTRQKSTTSHHHFKAGALNVLLRVSAILTNAPIVLTLDCDMYSNDPQAVLRSLCYLCDPAIRPNLAYVQFPQRFHKINGNDIYAGEYIRLYVLQPMGFDGLMGPNYLGSGCFFSRRAFFGAPTSLLSPEIPELSPNFVVKSTVQSKSVLAMAHSVASCTYEDSTNWGSKIGFRYGSLSEDFFTGLQMNAEGWKSVFCNPKRAAFLGDAPTCLLDMMTQQKRWSQGLLQVAFSKHCPLIFGVRKMGLLMGLGYALSAFWPFLSLPIITYSFIPQLALLNQIYVFPKVSESWFCLHFFLFAGAYGQDLLDFVLAGGTVRRWWNDQRIWHVRGLSCYVFGLVEFCSKLIGVSPVGFNVTSKVLEDEQRKRYEQGVFEFGVSSPMFMPLTMAALINLISFLQGLVEVFRGNLDRVFAQFFLCGFAVVNCWPVYDAMVLRSDKGKLPLKTIVTAACLAVASYTFASVTPKQRLL